MRLRFCFPALLVVLVGTWASARAEVDDKDNLMATPRVAGMLIQTVVTPVPLPTLAPKPTTPELVAAAPVPSIADEMVKVDPPSDKTAAPAPPATDKILQTDSQNRMSAPQRAAKITIYAGTGTSVVVGLNMPSDGGLNYRVEYSDGFKSVGASKTFGGGKYIESNTQQRLGLFVDWSPNQNNWSLTGGLTLNNQKFHFQSKSDAVILINGYAFAGESINFDFGLPKLTPYVGMRYASKSHHGKGWEGFAEVGAVLAKLDGDALIFDNSPTYAESDIRIEINTIRKSIYKWGVVPNALVGLSYRY